MRQQQQFQLDHLNVLITQQLMIQQEIHSILVDQTVIQTISAQVHVGFDLLVQAVLKYLRLQFQFIDVAQVQAVGIQVECPVFWI